GFCSHGLVDSFSDRARFRNHCEVVVGVDQRLDPVADHLVIVYKHDAETSIRHRGYRPTARRGARLPMVPFRGGRMALSGDTGNVMRTLVPLPLVLAI